MAAHHEDRLVAALVGPEWRIDPDGSIWRIAASPGGCGNTGGRSPLRPITPRRAEMDAPDGYYRIQGNPWGTGQKRALAHRAVWVYFNGSVPDGMQVNHKNGVKKDNRPENLELVTPQQNCLHRHHVLGHAMPHGYRTGSEKLTPAGVIEIRAAVAGGTPEIDLARKFSVEPKTIRDVVKRRTWRNVPETGNGA